LIPETEITFFGFQNKRGEEKVTTRVPGFSSSKNFLSSFKKALEVKNIKITSGFNLASFNASLVTLLGVGTNGAQVIAAFNAVGEKNVTKNKNTIARRTIFRVVSISAYLVYIYYTLFNGN